MAGSSAHAIAEAIASRDMNNLYRASSYLEDPEKYRAFCAYYALMRFVDDRVDGLPTRPGLSDQRRGGEHEVVSAWDAGVRSCYEGRVVPESVIRQCGPADARHLFEAFDASESWTAGDLDDGRARPARMNPVSATAHEGSLVVQ